MSGFNVFDTVVQSSAQVIPQVLVRPAGSALGCSPATVPAPHCAAMPPARAASATVRHVLPLLPRQSPRAPLVIRFLYMCGLVFCGTQCRHAAAQSCATQTTSLTAEQYDQIYAAIFAEVSAEPDRGTHRDHLGDLVGGIVRLAFHDVRQLHHHFGPSLTRFSALLHPTRAV